MRKVIDGNGNDSTSSVLAILRGPHQSSRMMYRPHLYLIGEPENPNSIWLTDWDSPLVWSWKGTFYPAVVKRSSVTTQVGLDPQTVDVTWAPKPRAFSLSVDTSSPRHLAQAKLYKNWRVWIWQCYMPTPGDANTLGCTELFGGRVGDTETGQDGIIFHVESYLNTLGKQVPPNVIEVLNTAVAYMGATPPSGMSHVPQFDVVLGSSNNVIVGDMISPSLHTILSSNNCRGGFLVFNQGGTLSGLWGAIQQNTEVTISGGHYNQFVLFGDLPWPPTPGVDTFYVSGPSPINKTDAQYIGFPYVPSSSQGF